MASCGPRTEAQYKLTDDAGISPFDVFGEVLEAIRQFLKNRKPDIMWFIADEPKRARLYNRLLARMRAPGYAMEVSGDGKYTVIREAFKEKQLQEVGEDSPRKKKQRELQRVRSVLLELAHGWVEEAIRHGWDEGNFSESKLVGELDVSLPYVGNLVIRDSHKGRRFELTFDGDEIEFDT